MTTKRAISMIIVSLSLLAGSALAQTDSNASLAERVLQTELRQELALTPKQEKQLTKLAEWERNDIRLIGTKRMISPEKRANLIREVREKSAKKVRAALTPEQRTKLESKE